MKNPGSDLHALIQSMGKGEKRYFTLYSSLHGKKESKKYLLLFKAIEQQATYDEKKIKEIFKNDAFISKRLDQAKISLYKLILKSLRNYNASGSVEKELRNLLIDARTLSDRKLYSQSSKILKRVEALASKYDRHVLMLDALEAEGTLMRQASFEDVSMGAISDHREQVLNYIELHKNTSGYEHLASQLFLPLLRQHKKGTRKEAAELKRISNSSQLRDHKGPLTLRAKELFYFSRSLYYAVNTDFISSYQEMINANKIYEDNEYLIKEYPLRYKKSLDFALIVLLEAKQYHLAGELLEKIKQMTLLAPQVDIADQMARNIVIEVDIYIKTGNYQKGITCILDAEKYFQKVVAKTQKRQVAIHFYYQCAHLFFLAGKFREAAKNINEVLNDKYLGSYSRTEIPAKLLQILIHYELNNIELAEYFIRSLYRYFYKKDRVYKMETLLLSFIRKHLSRANAIQVFKKLRIEIKDLLKKNPSEAESLLDFDFISWLDSKIENRLFAEVLQEKSKILQNKNLPH